MQSYSPSPILRSCPVCTSHSRSSIRSQLVAPNHASQTMLGVGVCNCQSNFGISQNYKGPQVEDSFVVRLQNENCKRIVRERGEKCSCKCGESEKEVEFWKSQVAEMERVYELEVRTIKENIMAECKTILVD